MKLTPDEDYRVFARHQATDEDPAIAQYFEGIHFMDINDFISIYFVPPIENLSGNKVQLPADFDAISSSSEARLCSFLYATCIVSPNDDLVGSSAMIPVDLSNPAEERSMPVFFVSVQEFDRLIAELQSIEELTISAFSSIRRSKLQPSYLLEFIESHILRKLYGY